MKKRIIISIIIFMIISLLSLYNSNLYIKQLLWYMFCFGLLLFLPNIKNIFKISQYLYWFGILLLILVLIVGKEINGAKAWINLKIINIQPSELMKLFLLLFLSNNFSQNKKKLNYKEELFLIIKMLLYFIIPAILTFIEPDTGAVIIYLIITMSILFKLLKHKLWKIIIGGFLIILIGTFFSLYFLNTEIFINIFGTSFFYRIDRLIYFYKQDSYQLNNALILMSQADFIGLNKLPLNIIEGNTDFIFATLVSKFGFIISFILLINYFVLDYYCLKINHKKIAKKYQLFINGFIAMFFFQQIYNIWMNIGLLPIMGITLPFISYGGSSLLIYIFCVSLIININDSMGSMDNMDMVDMADRS